MEVEVVVVVVVVVAVVPSSNLIVASNIAALVPLQVHAWLFALSKATEQKCMHSLCEIKARSSGLRAPELPKARHHTCIGQL